MASRMLEKAMADAKCLMAARGPKTDHALARFFSSALCCHRPIVRTKWKVQELSLNPFHTFLVSSVLPEVWYAVGETHAEEVRKLVENGTRRESICRVIEKRLLKVNSAHGGA